MRDYSKIFLGLIMTGIILIVVGLMLARTQHTRTGQAGELRSHLVDPTDKFLESFSNSLPS